MNICVFKLRVFAHTQRCMLIRLFFCHNTVYLLRSNRWRDFLILITIYKYNACMRAHMSSISECLTKFIKSYWRPIYMRLHNACGASVVDTLRGDLNISSAARILKLSGILRNDFLQSLHTRDVYLRSICFPLLNGRATVKGSLSAYKDGLHINVYACR